MLYVCRIIILNEYEIQTELYLKIDFVIGLGMFQCLLLFLETSFHIILRILIFVIRYEITMQKLFVKRQMSQTFTHTRFNGHMREIYLFSLH